MDVAYASARDRIGQTLCGKYFLDEVLGVGGTAVVFRATHRNGNRVAVKLLHDHLCKSRDITRRFMREAYLANLLEHPGTVRVLDDDADHNGVAFLVLELLEGETLEERRVRVGGQLGIDEVLGYVDRLLEVLELAHDKQIVHRDIKPSNLFITKDGILKVLDFGIARILDEHGGATATKTGQMIGTPAFMPPEQALSRPKDIDTQTDLWSVGATMFTLLSGELVHVAESSSEHLVKAATRQARSVSRVLPGVPANVEALVARALRFDKKDRWMSATEMRRELWRVRLDPGKPIGTRSAPPPRNATSVFPTIVGRRDSERGGPRETGMSLSGAPSRADATSRRAVFVSGTVAFALVASALTFALTMRASDKPSIGREANAVTKFEHPAPLELVEPAVVQTSTTASTFVDLAKPEAVAASVNAAPAPSAVADASGAKAVSVSVVQAPPRGPSSVSRKSATPAPTGDLYRPF